jgi:hypothetical protein
VANWDNRRSLTSTTTEEVEEGGGIVVCSLWLLVGKILCRGSVLTAHSVHRPLHINVDAILKTVLRWRIVRIFFLKEKEVVE